VGCLAVIVGCSAEHLGLQARLGQTISNLCDQLCHLNSSLLIVAFLVEEFEHLSDERLAHDKLEANFFVLFLQELLLEHEVLESSVAGLCLLLLVSHSHKQAKLVFSGQTSQCFLASKLGHFSLKFVFIDAQLLCFGVNRALALLVDLLLLL